MEETVNVQVCPSMKHYCDSISYFAPLMLSFILSKTAVKYYEASTEYGVNKVKEACFKWLLVNLLSFLPESPKR